MIGYVVSNFPKLSETFISREVLLLKKNDVKLNLYASKKPSTNEMNLFQSETKLMINEVDYFTKYKVFSALILNANLFLKYFKLAKSLSNEATNKTNTCLLLGRSIMLGKKALSSRTRHLHAHWPYATMVVYLVHKIFGITYSISIHAHEMFHENGHFKRTLKHMSFASFCNKAAMDVVIKNYPSLEPKCHLIYHGVNLNNFPLLKPLELNKRINIVSAGRLTSTKGFDRLIKACSICRERGLNIHLTILGIGGLDNELKEVAIRNNFRDYLNMPGWVDQENVRNYMSKSHFFALMADVNYHDGLPNVALEAMSVGRPVILSPLPAAKEAIINNENGFILTKKDDYEGFFTIINKLSNNPNAYMNICTNSRKKIETEFADYIHIKKMIELFKNC